LAIHVTRRALAALPAALFVSSATAQASYPDRPIRFVVPFAPGGTSDLTARLTGQHLARLLGVSVVIENKAGAASVIGTTEVARAAPDGYTMLLTPPPFVITQFATPNLPYDPEAAFRPVVLLITTVNVLFARSGLVQGGLPEILAMARARPGALTFASSGIGSLPHVAMELLKLRTGIDLLHVPYRGGGPAAADLAAGRVDLLIAAPAEMAGSLDAGRVVAIASASDRRSSVFPQLSTLQELGVPDFDASGWFGVTVPAGTPEAVVQRLNRDFNAVLALAEVKARLAEMGFDPAGGPPEAFAARLAAERPRWKAAVAAAGVRIQ
jgi:tripartite-type tricarboxylate transporter receptor subunit TctC